MKINSSGIWFKYHGDEMLWVWPWKRQNGHKYISVLFEGGFKDLNDYWYFCGGYSEACRKHKIVGFNEDQVFLEWAEITFRHNIVIILRNVNVIMKSTVFWKSIDVLNRKELLKEIPVLFFHNKKEAEDVIKSVDPEFGEAYLIVRGELIYTNNEKYAVKNGTPPDSGDYPGP
jgi:hypothetical protein